MHKLASLLLGIGLLAGCQAPIRRTSSPRPTAAVQPDASSPPFWGELRAGPHAVGFRHEVLYDTTRLHRGAKAGGDANRPSSKHPRPIPLGLWYPSPRGAAPYPPLPHGQYFEWPLEDANLEPLRAQLRYQGHRMTAEQVFGKPVELLTPDEEARLERLFSTPTAARASAAHEDAPKPLLVYHHGAGGTFEENSVLFEYLASHGYIVASVVPVPTDGLAIDDGASIDDEIRDLLFVIQTLHREFWVDKTRLGVLGHSLGAQLGLIFAVNHPAVDAVVSLDTTWDHPERQEELPNERYFERFEENATSLVSPLLAFASEGATFPQLERLKHAPRRYVTMGKLGHDEYLSQEAIVARLGDPDAASVRRKYEQICVLTREFLDAYVLGRPPRATQAGRDIVMQTREGLPPPPHVREIRDWVVDRGPAAAMQRCTDLAKQEGAGCPEGWVSVVAAGLVEEQRTDLAAGLLAAHVTRAPEDVPALLLLANTLEGRGEREKARAAYEQVLKKMPPLPEALRDVRREEIPLWILRRQAREGLERAQGGK